MFFSWKTKKGCKRLLALFLVIILAFGFIGMLFQSDFGKVKITQISVDYRGAKLSGELYYPTGTTSHDSLPAIIVAHGGANTYGTVKNFSAEFARRGFVVFSFSAYGQGLSEQPFYDDGEQGQDGFSNRATPAGFLDALNYVKELTYVDSSRIGIIGHSMGSYRGDNLLLLDNSYYTLNDIMINVLYNTFGVSLTEEEIYQDAAALAASKLNADQLAHFNDIYSAKLADYNDAVKAMCVTGIDRAVSNDIQTVNVGGYEVTRSMQVNLAFIDGEFDEFIFGFGTHDYDMAGWYSDVPLTMSKWYVLDDKTSSNSVIGDFFSDSVTSNKALASAIENRNARVFYVSEGEDHCKETISVETNSAMIEFFTQTLGYNCGELSNASTTPMDNNDSIFWGRVIANTITVLAFVGLAVALIGIFVKSDSNFVVAIDNMPDKKANFTKAQYWIFAAGLFAVAFYVLYKANKFWHAVILGWLCNTQAWPLSRPACISIYFLILVAVGNAIFIIAMAIWQKIRKEKLGLAALNINISIFKILKYLLCSFLILIVGYVINGTLTYFFGQDLRIWQTTFSDVKADQWYLVLKYAAVLLPFIFCMTCGINYMVRSDRPEWLDTLIAVVLNSLPIWILCIISIIVVNASGQFVGLFFCDFVCCYSLVGTIPIVTYINRKLFKLTNSVWLSAFVCSLLIAWSLVSALGTGDIYYPQTLLGSFFGV